jgi:hypothetical protein
MKIQIGQRIMYKDSTWHFICEVIEPPNKYKVIQHFYGHCDVGYIGTSESDFTNEAWVYLEGQDRPA